MNALRGNPIFKSLIKCLLIFMPLTSSTVFSKQYVDIGYSESFQISTQIDLYKYLVVQSTVNEKSVNYSAGLRYNVSDYTFIATYSNEKQALIEAMYYDYKYSYSLGFGLGDGNKLNFKASAAYNFNESTGIILTYNDSLFIGIRRYF